MALREVLTFPNPTLLKRSQDVEVFDEELQILVEDMHETMLHENGIGLAAPQIGILKRLIVIQIPESEEDEGEFFAFCNPVIKEKRGEAKIEEGCLSLPEFYVEVDRAKEITLEAYTPQGEKIILEADGLFAICIQHEIDHLDGKLLVNYVSSMKRDLYKKQVSNKV
ncbi:MAG TPA: peptide deformylase [Oligoflexia bacterium]|nr:peptide deformylase [Oligoflexia bacterium]HMR24467.1 peptide deformylase [Oligoflexia bacterium]